MEQESEIVDANWIEARARLAAALDSHDKALNDTQTMIVGQSEALRDWFRKRRKEMQEVAKEAEKASTPVGRRPRSLYAPLNLFARARSGNLEIYWQAVHKGKTQGKLAFNYLRRGKQGNYVMKDLLTMAKPFERDLIEQAELRAGELRAMWREFVKMRIACRGAIRVTDGAIGEAQASPGTKGDTGHIELVPSAPSIAGSEFAPGP